MCFSLDYAIFLVISFDQHNAQTLKNRNIFHFRVGFFFTNSYSIILVTENKSYEMATVCQNYNFAFISLDQGRNYSMLLC